MVGVYIIKTFINGWVYVIKTPIDGWVYVIKTSIDGRVYIVKTSINALLCNSCFHWTSFKTHLLMQ